MTQAQWRIFQQLVGNRILHTDKDFETWLWQGIWPGKDELLAGMHGLTQDITFFAYTKWNHLYGRNGHPRAESKDIVRRAAAMVNTPHARSRIVQMMQQSASAICVEVGRMDVPDQQRAIADLLTPEFILFDIARELVLDEVNRFCDHLAGRKPDSPLTPTVA